jgi:hypothetical protein
MITESDAPFTLGEVVDSLMAATSKPETFLVFFVSKYNAQCIIL